MTRVQDSQMIHALLRCVLSSPEEEFVMINDYLSGFKAIYPDGDDSEWMLRKRSAQAVLNAEPADAKVMAADLLGIDAEYDAKEWSHWGIKPNENYGGCFDWDLCIVDEPPTHPEVGDGHAPSTCCV